MRKNAVFAIASIYQTSESLIPDAPELIATFLDSENDHTCKRNALAALISISHEKALAYLTVSLESITNADELLQLVELEFIRKDAAQNTQNKVRPLISIFKGDLRTIADFSRHAICGSYLISSTLVLLQLCMKLHLH